MIALGEYLKAVRLREKISLKDVYKATGISDSKLSRIENGTNASDPAPGVLRALAELYEIDLVELYCIAGYLDREALVSYKQIFQNVELLTEEEKSCIQALIDLLVRERKQL